MEKIFNTESRTNNVLKSSMVGAISNIIKIILGFLYRSIFLKVLSAEYLGLNGLFTNLLQILSLAELGITTAITYRFYEPINNGDILKVGKLMHFFKEVYQIIAFFICGVGLLLLPFIQFFIKDSAEIPSNINLYVIYILFLFDTVSSYLFVYKQTILGADQKGYVVSFLQTIMYFFKYSIQIVFLLIFKNYTITLVMGIVSTVLLNFITSIWVTKKYALVFKIKEKLDTEEKKEIIDDTKSCMLHKVGATVKTSTDNVVIAKLVSLVATGLYSNYSLIISSLQSVINQLLGNFISSIGNAHVNLDKEQHYKVYRRLLFVAFWISCVTTVCLYTLLDGFITIWLGKEYLLDKSAVILLCMQYYITISRTINISYTNACGLFVKDKYRPIIEAFLNLILSIGFTYYIGIAGVFLGTVVSSVLTIFWREPLILYKNEFKKSVLLYWKCYFKFVTCTVVMAELFNRVLKLKNRNMTVSIWIIEAIIIFILCNTFLSILFGKTEEFKYLKELLYSLVKRCVKRR